jgi:hypothetical protein
MRRDAFEEWLILGILAAFTAVFAWYTKDGQQFDLVFILPLVIFIAVLCVVIALGVWKTMATQDTGSSEGKGSEREADAPSRKRGMFAVLMLLLLAGLSTVGFFTTLFLFLICAMWILGVRRWTTLLAVPVFLIAIVYLAFVQLLGLPISVSPLGLY